MFNLFISFGGIGLHRCHLFNRHLNLGRYRRVLSKRLPKNLLIDNFGRFLSFDCLHSHSLDNSLLNHHRKVLCIHFLRIFVLLRWFFVHQLYRLKDFDHCLIYNLDIWLEVLWGLSDWTWCHFTFISHRIWVYM